MEKTNKRGVLLLGDTHIEKDSIDELDSIFAEVFKIPAKVFIQLGDLCEKNVVNAEELDFLTRFAVEAVNRFDQVIALKGNHDEKDKTLAITDYLNHLGVNIVKDEYYYGEKTSQFSSKAGALLLGHFFTDKSFSSFGHHRYTIEELNNRKDFHYCFLGHQHDYQKLSDNMYHLGSARYTSFAEKEDVKKRVAWLHDGIIEFIEIKSAIPIYNVSDIKTLETIPSRAKVRYIYSSFSNLMNEVAIVNKLKSKFYEFKSMTKFSKQNKTLSNDSSEEKNYNKIIEKYILESVDDKQVQNMLIEEFKNNVH